MWNTFDQHDWMAFSGAEQFPRPEHLTGSREPLANYALKVDDLEACAIVDANGLAIEVLTPDGETVVNFYGTLSQGILFVARSAVQTSWETGELVDMGLAEERADH